MGIIMKLWIARDIGGHIALYKGKPFMNYNFFTRSCDWYYDNTSGDFMTLPDDCLPEVTFENSPQEVELVIKK